MFDVRISLALALFLGAVARSPAADSNTLPPEMQWPAATRETRPWTRWWWMGSAVDQTNLARLLTDYRQAGLGGVEICPIYGAKGYEDRFIDFLSPKWMDMLAYTTTEAKRLDLGVDLTTGTGWPFGGPEVTADDASARVNFRRYELNGGETFAGPFPRGRIQCVEAFLQNPSVASVPSVPQSLIDLTTNLVGGQLHWTAPPGRWRLYAVAIESPVQKVKRAAPGGVGDVLDPFSTTAMDHYLARFDRAFADYHGAMPRCQFHDSYEYYNADWCPDFFNEFQQRRGYDLRTELPAFFGDGSGDAIARVRGDYRETISDLHRAYIQRWTDWAHSHGSWSREQAHGSPANLIDVYATADIPETEIFGSIDESAILMNKFSSSAAHVAGRKFASSESFTWLTNHFEATLAQVKQAADYLFLSGVNHIFFHGIPYSPADAPWPGWQFYAAVNFGPEGGLWHDLPAFNAYVTRCQSILQSGQSANDVLLYFPIYDLWNSRADLLMTFTVHNVDQWLGPTPFYSAARTLWTRGYGYDVVSDAFLKQAELKDGGIVLNGNRYRVIVVPQTGLLPPATLRTLLALARDGAQVVFQGKPPEDVPGFGNREQRRAELKSDWSPLNWKTNDMHVREATIGKGRFLNADDLETLLQTADVTREPCVDAGLRFVRRTHTDGYHYFIANRSSKAVDGWVALGTRASSAILLDPRADDRVGVGALRDAGGATQIYLQLEPGESCIVRTFDNKKVDGPAWHYVESSGTAQTLAGDWSVHFIEGGPQLPAAYQTRELASWTTRDDPEAKRFAGTAAYTIEFDRPSGGAVDWLLDLGRVCESARVTLNGHPLMPLWCPPFAEPVGQWLKPGKNELRVEVTNIAANRVADLDRRKVNWKYFYDTNVVNRSYRPFDASDWPLFDSGLLGPVTLTPLEAAKVE